MYSENSRGEMSSMGMGGFPTGMQNNLYKSNQNVICFQMNSLLCPLNHPGYREMRVHTFNTPSKKLPYCRSNWSTYNSRIIIFVIM